MLVQIASARMAYALMPPEYPASQLKGQWQSGGPDAMWDRRTYYSADSVDNVLAYYEKHLPGFTIFETPQHGVEYINGKCDESWSARYVARLINEGHYPDYTADNVPLPCVSVSIYQATGNSHETQYEIWLDWPAN
jgi:hypothetical protein